MVPQKMGNENIWFLKDLFDPQSWTKTVETKKRTLMIMNCQSFQTKLRGGGAFLQLLVFLCREIEKYMPPDFVCLNPLCVFFIFLIHPYIISFMHYVRHQIHQNKID